MEWENRYLQKGSALKDNVAVHAYHTNGLFYWSDAPGYFSGENSARIVCEAADVGLVEGWIFTQERKLTTECAIISISAKSIKKKYRN
ncbi:autoinducer binding domain-containing protein [uncultured Desulfobacter sp.]|uniref:autoinducer binding domain-containing protein n=1 Tax=uncultured Desulfobacter sp. TaxID=240139 RepID=UPI0037498839